MLKFEGIGTLVKDPVLRTVKIGTDDVEVCDLRMAFDQFNGKVKHTEFFDCTAWRGMAKTLSQYTSKGRKLFISGGFKSREYDKDVSGTVVKMKAYHIDINEFEFCDKMEANTTSTPATPVVEDIPEF